MSTVKEARTALTLFFNKNNARFITFVGKAENIRPDEGLCDVQPIDGSPLFHDVRLVLSVDNVVDGLIPVPMDGSFVICGRLENENDVFIIRTSEISKFIVKCSEAGKIELNGDDYSIVKGENIRKELLKVQSLLEAIITVIKTPVNEAGGGSPSVFQGALNTAIATLENGDFTDILNNKVKHG